MNNAVNITFWGTRGSTPSANAENMHFGGNTTCVQIKIPESEELLILDCGTGFRNLGNELISNRGGHKGRIFITHPHWDHLQGFPFFKPFYDSKNTFRIFIPPQGNVGCKEILQGHMSGTFFPISVDMLEADIQCETYHQEEKDFNQFSINYMWGRHPIPVALFKLKVGNKVIVFAPDNELPIDESEESVQYLTDFSDFIHDADVLIHDAQYSMEKYKNRQGWGHSAWERVVDIANKEKVKQLYLTHHDPDSTDDYLFGLNEKIRNEHSHKFQHLSLVKEGQEVALL